MKALLMTLLSILTACLATQAQLVVPIPKPEILSDSLLKLGIPQPKSAGGVLSMGTGFYRDPKDAPNVVRATLDNMPVRKPVPDQEYKIQNPIPIQPPIDLIPRKENLRKEKR